MYEIRDTRYEIETNVEYPKPSEECRREVRSTLDTRCKKQEIRLSSVDMKILPTEHDFHLASCVSSLASQSVLILDTSYFNLV